MADHMVLQTDERQLQPKALYVLRRNIEALLATRKEDQVALARWVGHSRSWLNKFLLGDREIQLRDLDRIGTFFGIEPYQLFQPGIGRLTERRSGLDRRNGRERRIGHAVRLATELQIEVNKVPRLASARGAPHGPSLVPHAVQVILADAERRIAAVYAQLGEQASSPRGNGPGTAKRRRGIRGPDSETA